MRSQRKPKTTLKTTWSKAWWPKPSKWSRQTTYTVMPWKRSSKKLANNSTTQSKDLSLKMKRTNLETALCNNFKMKPTRKRSNLRTSVSTTMSSDRFLTYAAKSAVARVPLTSTLHCNSVQGSGPLRTSTKQQPKRKKTTASSRRFSKVPSVCWR